MTKFYEEAKAAVRALHEMNDAELKSTLIGRRVKTTWNGKTLTGTIADLTLAPKHHMNIATKYAVSFDNGEGGWVFADKATIIG